MVMMVMMVMMRASEAMVGITKRRTYLISYSIQKCIEILVLDSKFSLVTLISFLISNRLEI